MLRVELAGRRPRRGEEHGWSKTRGCDKRVRPGVKPFLTFSCFILLHFPPALQKTLRFERSSTFFSFLEHCIAKSSSNMVGQIVFHLDQLWPQLKKKKKSCFLFIVFIMIIY